MFSMQSMAMKFALIFSVLLINVQVKAFAQLNDSCGCNAGLAPEIVKTDQSSATQLAFIQQIDERQYEELKKTVKADGSFLDLVSGSVDYGDFQKRRSERLSRTGFNLSASDSQSFLLSRVSTENWLKCKKICITRQTGFSCDWSEYTDDVVTASCSWRPVGSSTRNRVKIVANMKSEPDGYIQPNTTSEWQFHRDPDKPLLITFNPENGNGQTLKIEPTPKIEDVRVQLSSSVFSMSVNGSSPMATASIPSAVGTVVGGGCSVTFANNGSPHALVMVTSQPSGNGWECKGTDPPNLPMTGGVTANATALRVTSSRPSVQLACMTISNASVSSENPLATVRLSNGQLADGYVLTSGGCSTAHAGFGASHAAPTVETVPTSDLRGWSCRVVNPPFLPLVTQVTAHARACRLEDTSPSALAPIPRLQSRRFDGQKIQGVIPKSTATVDAGWTLTGGGCALGYAGNGSPHGEFLVKSASNANAWDCWGADPPNLSNPSFASSSAIGLRVAP
jgi:hypothetical protein